MTYPDVPDPAPIVQVRFASRIPSAGQPWWRRRPDNRTLAIGGASALALAVVLGLVLGPSGQADPGASATSRPALVTPASAVEQLRFRRAAEPYQAPARAQVERAFSDVRATLESGGASGLARAGLDCFRRLEARPSYALMDYCIAYDLFAEAENGRLAGGERPSPTSWFGAAGARQLNVAQSIMAVEGDADARLLDLRRIASEVAARRGGPPLVEIPPGALPPPPNPLRPVQATMAPGEQVAVEVVEPALPTPVSTGAAPLQKPSARAASAVRASGAAPAPAPAAEAAEPAIAADTPRGDEFPDAPAARPEPIDVPAPAG